MVFLIIKNLPQNPFNPSTTIEFPIPVTQNVTVKVFNSIGHEIETLVSKKLNAGVYSFNRVPKNLPGGIYFYQLTNERYKQARKLILMK